MKPEIKEELRKRRVAERNAWNRYFQLLTNSKDEDKIEQARKEHALRSVEMFNFQKSIMPKK